MNVQQAYEKLLPMDLSVIGNYLVDKKKIGREEVPELETEYKRFIALCIEGNCVPTDKIDEMWHAHILHTKKYESMCRELGTFIHHVPNEDKKYLEDTFNFMLGRYEQCFGSPSKFWTSYSDCGGTCARCDND